MTYKMNRNDRQKYYDGFWIRDDSFITEIYLFKLESLIYKFMNKIVHNEHYDIKT